MKKTFAFYSISIAQILYAVQLDPIIIESSKLTDNLMDIPISIDVLSSDMLSISSTDTLHKLSSMLPNTNISGLGNRSDTTISMRGIANYVTTESSVALYVDDAPIPFSYGFGAIDFSNIERIEVFKGAQGTDFGKNAESGVINFYTKPITDHLISEALIDFGSNDTKKFYGRLSGPSGIDKLGFLISLSDNRTDGYTMNALTANHLDYRHMSNYNTKFIYTPDSHLDVSFNYTKTKLDDGGTAFKIDTYDNPYRIDDEPRDDWVKMDNDLVSLVVRSIQNSFTLTSISTYGKESLQKNDYIGKLGTLNLAMNDEINVNIEEISQELRLNGMYKNIDYVIGGFYSDKLRFKYIENQTFPSVSVYNNSNHLDNLDTNKAIFGKIRYALDDSLSFTSGLRYQQTKRNFTRDYSGFTSVLSSTVSSAQWLPTFSLAYDKNGNNLYLTYTKGYRPGGYNYRSPGTTLIQYLPEITESLELGSKNTFNPLWNLSTALFYNRIRDVRTITFDDYLATTTRNADKAHSYGIESSLNYHSDNTDFFGNIGFTRTEFDRFMVGTTDYSGKHLIDVPDMTVALGGKYKFYADWYATASLNYMGKRYYDIANTKQENGYTTLNTAIGYTNKKYSVEIYANNLFDSENVDFMIHTPSHDYYHFGAPSSIGFHIGMTFN